MALAAVFLDRDGVIIENRDDHVKSWEEVQFIPGAFEGLKKLSQSSYAIVLVTNQSVVGRGMITLEQAHAINDRVIAEIKSHGGRIDASYLCPHHPDAGCACRKPRPGLLLQAAQELDLQLTSSYLIGDALTDIQAAQAAGVKGILVLSGRGVAQAKLVAQLKVSDFLRVADLRAAVDLILEGRD